MKILYNGVDIYNDVSVNYCVHEMFAEKQADTLVIRFNDTNGVWSKWNPEDGDSIRLVEGADDTGKMFVHFMKSENGLFTIRAMSVPKSGITKRTKSWKGVRFLQLGKEIAERHGLEFQSYGCSNELYRCMNQEKETDFAFYSYLCMLEGCQMLIYDGRLLVYNEKYMENQTVSGSLDVEENGVFAYMDNRAAVYNSCEVSKGGFLGKFVLSDADNTKIFRPDIKIAPTSESEAMRFSKGLLRNENKYGRTGKFSKGLLTAYAAASLLRLKTQKASAWDGIVFVYKVRHDFIGNKTTIYFRDILEGY